MTIPSNGTWLSTTQFVLDVVFLVLITIFLSLRLWSRTLQKGLRPRALTVSDYVIITGYLATVGNTCCMIGAIIVGGSGRHVEDLTDQEQRNGQKALFAAAFFWLTGTCTLKMSILLLYTEIFKSRRAQLAAYGLLSLVAAFYLAFLITIFAQCTPFSMNWIKDEQGHCVNLTAESRAGTLLNIIFDSLITILPIPMIWGLQMPLKKRLGLVALFGLGSAADAINIARAIITMNPSGEDYSYFSAKTNILADMELWLGVIIACAPLIKPALARMRVIDPSSVSGYDPGRYNKPVYRSDPEMRAGSSAMLGQRPVPPALTKQGDAWERQFHHLESDDESLPLRDLSHCSTPEPLRKFSVPTP